jgi:hypothetical protein
MATLTRALRISNLNDFHAWATFSSSTHNGAVSWIHTRTPLVTLSAAECEVVALSAATQEAVYLRKLANELGFTKTSPTTHFEHCTAAVALSKEREL